MNNVFKFKTIEQIKAENTHNDNLYGLVYEGAIRENKQGKVNIHPISYDLKGLRIAANVYTPAKYDENSDKKYPAICVAHPNGGVKEQVAGLYAQRLAEKGYISIVSDASYQGSSEGEPRNTDKPSNRIEDIHRMADIIVHYPGVDSERIGILGICGGGGYTIKAVFNTGVVRINGFLDSQTSTIQERLIEASRARGLETSGKEVLYTSDMCDMPEEEAQKLPYDLYKDGYYYYGKTHKHPKSTFRYTVSSFLELMNFDAADNADLINQPLLMISESIADTFYMTKKVFAASTGTKNKELFLIKGATHIETYWKPEYVKQATSKLKEFFGKYL